MERQMTQLGSVGTAADRNPALRLGIQDPKLWGILVYSLKFWTLR